MVIVHLTHLLFFNNISFNINIIYCPQYSKNLSLKISLSCFFVFSLFWQVILLIFKVVQVFTSIWKYMHIMCVRFMHFVCNMWFILMAYVWNALLCVVNKRCRTYCCKLVDAGGSSEDGVRWVVLHTPLSIENWGLRFWYRYSLSCCGFL